MNKIVSIIVPCYNQAKYLSETLDTVLVQSYSNWECIIVNDGSTDDTDEVASRYCNLDSRFKYFYKHNGGLSSARNYGIANSAGEYILPLDSDDKIARDYIKEAVHILNTNKAIKIVYSKAELFGKRKGAWDIPEFSIERMLATNLIFCTALYRKEDYNKTGGYNTNMKFGFEDWDFWLSILEEGGEVHKIEKVMFYYRIRKGSMLRSMSYEQQSYLRRTIWNNHRKLYSEYMLNPLYSFEYMTIHNSAEYKVGRLLVEPLRKLLSKFGK